MITIVAMLAASQIPLPLDAGELRWRRFVHQAAATEAPSSTRMSELRRSVRLLRAERRARGVSGPSGL